MIGSSSLYGECVLSASALHQSSDLGMRCSTADFYPPSAFNNGCAGQELEGADEQIINDYIGNSFLAMKDFGPKVYRPFMQVSHDFFSG